jgi:hypothetical protein
MFYPVHRAIPKWIFPCPICGLRKHKDWIINFVHTKWATDQNCFIGVVGRNRSGKSTFCLKYLELLDSNLSINNWFEKCAFDIETLFVFWENYYRSVGILEETGIENSRLKWYSDNNINFLENLQRQGLKLNCIFFNVPNTAYFTDSALASLDLIIRCENHWGKYSAIVSKVIVKSDTVKPKSDLLSKSYVGRIEMKTMPSKWLIDEYKIEKERWNKYRDMIRKQSKEKKYNPQVTTF